MRGFRRRRAVESLDDIFTKEFDAIVIFDDKNSSPLVYCKEQPPHPRSRKLLRVGMACARCQVRILTDLFNPSVLLNRHNLQKNISLVYVLGILSDWPKASYKVAETSGSARKLHPQR
jgi:hypothetical protein